MDDWDAAEDIPPPCMCGNTLWWWWDDENQAHCVTCEPQPLLHAARLAGKSFLFKNTEGYDVSEVVAEGKSLKRALVGAKVVDPDHDFVKEAGCARPGRYTRDAGQ